MIFIRAFKFVHGGGSASTDMILSVTLTLLLVLVTTLTLFLRKQFRYWTQYKTVPSVPGQIFSGNFRDFIQFKTNFNYHLKTIYDDPKFADAPVIGVYDMYKPGLLIKDPDIVKSILIRDFDKFHDRFPKNDYHHDPLGAQMIFFAEYSLWREVRTKLNPVFASSKLKHMYPLIKRTGENIANYLSQQSHVHRVDMKDFSSRFTTDAMDKTMFGGFFKSNSLLSCSEELHKAVLRLTYFSTRRGFNFAIAAFATKLTRLLGCKILFPETERFLRLNIPEAVAERERLGEKRCDMIDAFVKMKQEASQKGINLTKFMEVLEAQAGFIMVAGFETSSTTMSNCLLELAKHPEEQKKLRDEIQQVYREANGDVTYEDMSKLIYMEMVINETLRLYPVLPMIARQYHTPAGKEPYSLMPYCDFTLPEGMPIYISSYSLHHDAEVSFLVILKKL